MSRAPLLTEGLSEAAVTTPALDGADLGFEPSYEALRMYCSDVANALLCLPMRRNHTAITLEQHWARRGNIFPYFSPVPRAAPW
jgi:hypothetical protein